MAATNAHDCEHSVQKINAHARACGFSAVGITHTDLGTHRTHFVRWLRKHRHGTMRYMARNIKKRLYPDMLVPKTVSIICVRLDYATDAMDSIGTLLHRPDTALISRYALGRDYHKVLRAQLKQLATRLRNDFGASDDRIFVDSAPVLEKALAEKSGLGWIGKHTNLIHHQDGSWFFLGELFTNLHLPVTSEPLRNRCGTCTQCIDICPTKAITAPYTLDARRCISYLTIEHHGSIPHEFRTAIGNRIYGCDDCQWICPWNRFAKKTPLIDFSPRHGLDAPKLIDLFRWTPTDFSVRTEGSAIRRIGHERWQRNCAVAVGNAPYSTENIDALKTVRNTATPLVCEHIDWALSQQYAKQKAGYDR